MVFKRCVFLFSVLLALALSGCRKDKTNLTYKECYAEITATSRAYFYEDARQFGIQRLMADTLSDYYLNPLYREEETVYVLGKMSAIFNTAATSPIGTPLYDIVFKYPIHKEMGTHLNRLVLIATDWEVIYDIEENFGTTQNETLNQLIDRYDLTFGWSGYFIDTSYVVIKSEKNYIMNHIARQLKGTSGLFDARPLNYPMIYGEGSGWFDIYYNWTEQYDEFIFQLGFGDCPAGCTEFHYWQVRVYKDCSVEFISEYGDPLPG